VLLLLLLDAAVVAGAAGCSGVFGECRGGGEAVFDHDGVVSSAAVVVGVSVDGGVFNGGVVGGGDGVW